MKKCVFCSEEIQDDAKICKHCSREQKKKTPLWQWALLIIFGLFIYSVLKSADMGSSQNSSRTPSPAPISVQVNKFTTHRGYYSVVGHVQNDGSIPYRFVRVNATFYDKSKNVSGTDWTYACGQDFVQPKARKAFEITGRDPGDYDSVNVAVESYKK